MFLRGHLRFGQRPGRLDGGDEPCADGVPCPGRRKAANAREVGLAGRGRCSKIGQRLVFHDPAARHVLVPRFQFAPAGQRLQPAQNIGLAVRKFQPLPRAIRVHHVVGWIGQPCHFLVQPFPAIAVAKLAQHLGEQLRKMGDIADGILDLPIRQRPARPVGEAGALVDLVAAEMLDEIGITDLLAHPHRHRGNLRIEHRKRHASGKIHENLDVLPPGVQNFQHRFVGQKVEERVHIEALGQWIERKSVLRACQLDQAKLWIISIFPHELGIYANMVMLHQALAQSSKGVGIGDQRVNLHAVR